jgi:hypothetical protein
VKAQSLRVWTWFMTLAVSFPDHARHPHCLEREVPVHKEVTLVGALTHVEAGYPHVVGEAVETLAME